MLISIIATVGKSRQIGFEGKLPWQEIKTIKDGLENRFLMDIEDIKKSQGNSYNPKIISFNKPTTDKNGTDIWLRKVKRKTGFKIDEIISGLSKKFLIFDRIESARPRSD